MNKYIQIIGIIILCVASYGCNSLSTKMISQLGYEKIDDVNKKIEQAKRDAQEQIDANNDKIKSEELDIQNNENQKEQSAANYIFNSEFAFTTIPSPTRTEMVMNVNDKSAASFLPSPTSAAIQSALTEVKDELNETLTTNADLQKKLSDAQTTAQILNVKETADQTTINQLKTSNQQIVDTTSKTVDTLQQAKDSAVKNALSTLQDKLNNSKEIEALKEKIMWITGILALACIAGAFYSPILKRQFAEMAALMGFVTISIMYITPFILICAGIIILIIILCEIGIQHNTAVQTIATTTGAPIATVTKAVASNTISLVANKTDNTNFPTTNK